MYGSSCLVEMGGTNIEKAELFETQTLDYTAEQNTDKIINLSHNKIGLGSGLYWSCLNFQVIITFSL